MKTVVIPEVVNTIFTFYSHIFELLSFAHSALQQNQKKLFSVFTQSMWVGEGVGESL